MITPSMYFVQDKDGICRTNVVVSPDFTQPALTEKREKHGIHENVAIK
jgi:hypothetical protein